jgi:spore coat polysaccharide biosynthesis protein SpsF
MLQQFLGDWPDYLSNTLDRSFPRGLDAEIFTAEALWAANAEADAPHQREHVTPFIYEHPDRFTLASFVSKKDESHRRWTLDTVEDLIFLRSVFEALPEGQRDTARMSDILGLLDSHPEFEALNASIAQKPLRSP